MAVDARSDVVGSLLRPASLLKARERHAAGELDAAAFKAVEDAAVAEVLRRQVELGLQVITDGELRRLSFQSQMVEAVDGFGSWDLDAFLWGDWHGDEAVGDRHVDTPQLAVVDRLTPTRFLAVEELVYARAHARSVVKVTLPSPSLFASFWHPERSRDAYEDLAAMLDEVTAILEREVAELARLGCTYVQLDAPHYTMFADPDYRAFYAGRGIPADDWIAFGLGFDNRVLAAAAPMTTAFHLCRGNQGSRWLVSGGYEALAESVLSQVGADRLMLEYDDARSGGFDPLAVVPAERTVVLGLVSTKSGRLEDPEAVLRRLDEATRWVPGERLALSTQCGFGTSVVGNDLTEDEQWAKLALVADVARRWWAV